jgi:hypothetical protein
MVLQLGRRAGLSVVLEPAGDGAELKARHRGRRTPLAADNPER